MSKLFQPVPSTGKPLPTRATYIYNVNIYTFFEIKHIDFQPLTKY